MRAEGIHAHGYHLEASSMAVDLANDLLKNPPDLTATNSRIDRENKTESSENGAATATSSNTGAISKVNTRLLTYCVSSFSVCIALLTYLGVVKIRTIHSGFFDNLCLNDNICAQCDFFSPESRQESPQEVFREVCLPRSDSDGLHHLVALRLPVHGAFRGPSPQTFGIPGWHVRPGADEASGVDEAHGGETGASGERARQPTQANTSR